ncbi:hypothetical protein Unana1_08084 [Umbelopsis nana]
MKLSSALALSLLASTVHGVADHLWYHTNIANVTDWYNEVTVHPGDDPVSTYFMTNGFSGGYFGIQPNSPTRTVLFSVWDADDGTKTTQQFCGKLSHCSTFGGEGTGLHANYDLNWTAGVTYAGLVRTSPLGNGYTDISGYFRDANNQWYHLATYRRKTNSPYFSGLYSFVENFQSILLNQTRKTNFGNQWVRNAAHHTQEMTVADLTHTTLAAGDVYGAGVENTSFYLFINGPKSDIPSNTTLVRKPTGKVPDFDMTGKAVGGKPTGGKTTSSNGKTTTKSSGHRKSKSATHHKRGKKAKSHAKKHQHKAKVSNHKG